MSRQRGSSKPRVYKDIDGVRHMECWKCKTFKPCDDDHFPVHGRWAGHHNKCLVCKEKGRQARQKRPRFEKVGYIYFVRVDQSLRWAPNGFIKIGFTQHLQQRMKYWGRLFCGASVLLGVMEGSMRDEQSTHYRFREHCIGRSSEHFRHHPDIYDFIKNNTHRVEDAGKIKTNWLDYYSRTNQLELPIQEDA